MSQGGNNITALLIVGLVLLLGYFYLQRRKEGFADEPAKPKPKKYDIVVAQYKEDVSWLLPYAKFVKLFVKSEHKNLSAISLEKAGATVKMLPNIGREAHTYLQYIIDNYDNLPDYVVFTQGSIDPHLSKHDFDTKIVNLGAAPISTNYSEGDNDGKKWGFHLESYDGKLERADMNLGGFIKKYVKRDVPQNGYPVYWAAIFSVSRDLILKRSKAEYQEMIKPLSNSSNTEWAHFFERMWYYIFS